jgi:hypothetical protein
MSGPGPRVLYVTASVLSYEYLRPSAVRESGGSRTLALAADYRRAWRVAKAIKGGTVWVNTYKQFSISTPFSGLKDSGVGTEKGREGIRSYMNQKSIYLDLSGQPLSWAEASAKRGPTPIESYAM